MRTALFIVIVLSLFITAPSSAGKYKTLVPGTSSRSDVKNILGDPVREIQPDRYYEYSSQGHALKTLLVQYDEKKIVHSIQLKFLHPYPVSKVKKWFNLNRPDKSETDFHGYRNDIYTQKGIILHFDGAGKDATVAGLSHVPVPSPAISTKPIVKPLPKSSSETAQQSYNRAEKLKDQKHYAEAIPHYRNALRLDPNKTDYYDGLAVCLRNKGNREEAYSLFKSSMKLKKTYYNTYHYGAMLYFDDREKEAIPYLKRSAELLKPGTKWYWPYLRMGQAHYILMEDAKAKIAFKQADKMKPSDPDITYYLGICSDNLGEKNAAIAYYKQYLAMKTNNERRNAKINKNLRALNKSESAKKAGQSLMNSLFKVIDTVSKDLKEN